MRASDILQKSLSNGGVSLHAKRWAALWRAVAALLYGQQLWLTALGRNLPGNCADKHRIKAVDRLLGCAAIQAALPMLYAALARYLLRAIPRPAILVDWTGAGPEFHVLSAKLCFQGRAICIFARAFPNARKGSPKAEREFLNELVDVVPSGCTPVLVTDAGFHAEWFDAVLKHGWDFIGRVRGRLVVWQDERWVPLRKLHRLAGKRPKDLGIATLRRIGKRRYRLVLAAKRRPKGRERLTRRNKPGQRSTDRKQRKSAREPWLLATSLKDCSRVIVQIYMMRMQIEEAFRDLKSRRYGWSLQDMRCKDARRVDMLLLIGALAAISMHTIGLAAARRNLERNFQANTERKRNVFSTMFLARLVIHRGLEPLLPITLLHSALTQLRTMLAAASLPSFSR
jgi:hypothetical protein